MIQAKDTVTLPKTLEEFKAWEPEDEFKYEWNDGEIIKFVGMNKTQFHIFGILNRFFISKGYWQTGTFITEQDVQLTGIQMRRPNIAYFSIEQEGKMRQGEDEIPEFLIEIISGSDNAYKIEEKITEYFKAGVRVMWLIYPENQIIHVYTSRKQVKICTDDDICSAKPILPEFELSVNAIFA